MACTHYSLLCCLTLGHTHNIVQRIFGMQKQLLICAELLKAQQAFRCAACQTPVTEPKRVGGVEGRLQVFSEVDAKVVRNLWFMQLR